MQKFLSAFRCDIDGDFTAHGCGGTGQHTAARDQVDQAQIRVGADIPVILDNRLSPLNIGVKVC